MLKIRCSQVDRAGALMFLRSKAFHFYTCRGNKAVVQKLPVLAFPAIAPDGSVIGDRAAAEDCPAAEKGPVQM